MARVSFKMEFIFRSSAAILYQFTTTPDCLVRWFCDEVDVENEIYTFIWSGSEESAEMLDDIEEERVRFRWLEAPSASEYFEFKFRNSDVTTDTILILTDFCDADELEEQKELWITQMEELRRVLGG